MIDLSKYKDVNEVFGRKRMTYKDKCIVEREHKAIAKFYGIQCMIDSLRKKHATQVCSTEWDPNTKSATLNVITNSKNGDIKQISFSYDDICREMHWKSFKVIGPDTIEPKWMTFEEIEAEYEKNKKA